MRSSSRPSLACVCCAVRCLFRLFWLAASFRLASLTGALLAASGCGRLPRSAPCLQAGGALRLPAGHRANAPLPRHLAGGGSLADRLHANGRRISGTREVDPAADVAVADLSAQGTTIPASGLRS